MTIPESNSLDVDGMTQRDPFNLASLPELQPPTDGWTAISAQLQQQRRGPQQWIPGLALAATITLVIGAVALLPQEGFGPSSTPAETAVVQQEPASSNDPVEGTLEPNDIRGQGRSYSKDSHNAGVSAQVPVLVSTSASLNNGSSAANATKTVAENNPNLGPENLQSLQRLSGRLEQNLNYLRTGIGAMPAEMVVYQVELEDLVAQVDAAISQQPESSELWQQRVNLLMDLNEIYGVGLRREEPYVASL